MQIFSCFLLEEFLVLHCTLMENCNHIDLILIRCETQLQIYCFVNDVRISSTIRQKDYTMSIKLYFTNLVHNICLDLFLSSLFCLINLFLCSALFCLITVNLVNLEIGQYVTSNFVFLFHNFLGYFSYFIILHNILNHFVNIYKKLPGIVIGIALDL